ncbi:hypothetical protein ACBJ59_12325 [Nonomuraea sp. MTCD27]|uniref:hypothetical protein n=1 Tax=Nonomuraea sp. MTCD27 TaxID=1676747 RepID=UPI0035C19055
MNAAVVFALVVGGLAAVLFDASLRARRWLEAGISAGAMAVCSMLAVAAGLPAVPLWLLILAVWVVVVLAGLAAWSFLRHREKTRTGEETR